MTYEEMMEKLKKYIMDKIELSMRFKEQSWIDSKDKKNPRKDEDEQMYHHYQGMKLAYLEIYELIVSLEYKAKKEQDWKEE